MTLYLRVPAVFTFTHLCPPGYLVPCIHASLCTHGRHSWFWNIFWGLDCNNNWNQFSLNLAGWYHRVFCDTYFLYSFRASTFSPIKKKYSVPVRMFHPVAECIVTGLRVGRSGAQITGGTRGFSLLQIVQTCSLAHPALYSMDTRVLPDDNSHLLPSLWMTGALPPLRLYACTLCVGLSSGHCSHLLFYALVAFLGNGRT